MENFLLEKSFASVKEFDLDCSDAQTRFYLIIQRAQEALHFKVVNEKSLSEYQNIVFKKLYCISNDPNFNIQNITRIQDSDKNSSQIILGKSLTHPSVKTLRQVACNQVVKQEEIKVQKDDPFVGAKKKKTKAGLNKESFFASFRKVKEDGATGDKETVQDKDDAPVMVKKVESVKEKKEILSTKKLPKVSEKSQNQEAALVNMFENEIPEEKQSSQEEEDDSANSNARVRKKRKVMKTMTFMEGKYMKTKDVETWESFSESEKEEIKKDGFIDIQKKRKPQGQQHSISSFFSRK